MKKTTATILTFLFITGFLFGPVFVLGAYLNPTTAPTCDQIITYEVEIPAENKFNSSDSDIWGLFAISQGLTHASSTWYPEGLGWGCWDSISEGESACSGCSYLPIDLPTGTYGFVWLNSIDANGFDCDPYTFEECKNNLGALGEVQFLTFTIGITGNILDISDNTPADILSYTGQLYTDLTPFILLIIGVPVGFFIIRKIILLFRK